MRRAFKEVFPAQAGVIPRLKLAASDVDSLSRASGGDPEANNKYEDKSAEFLTLYNEALEK